MIEKYDLSADKKLSADENASAAAFLQIVSPSKEEIGQLVTAFHFPFDYIGGILDDYEKARYEEDEHGNHLLLLQYPAQSDTGEIETFPYALIITADKKIIFALNHEVTLDALFTRTYDVKRLSHQLVYQVISQLTESFQQYLTDFRAKRHEVSAHIQKSTKNDQLMTMIQMQASLVYFQDALMNNLEVLRKFQQDLEKNHEDGFAERVYDLYVETSQAMTEARIQEKLLENLRDLFSNIVANNLNIVMKIMTSATFVLGIPAVITGFYGMNVTIPGQWAHGLVWLLAGLIIILCGSVSYWLHKKDMM